MLSNIVCYIVYLQSRRGTFIFIAVIVHCSLYLICMDARADMRGDLAPSHSVHANSLSDELILR